jgi:hypothetical protein
MPASTRLPSRGLLAALRSRLSLHIGDAELPARPLRETAWWEADPIPQEAPEGPVELPLASPRRHSPAIRSPAMPVPGQPARIGR